MGKHNIDKEAIAKGRVEYQRRLKAGLVQRKDPLRRALENPTSLRKAIDAKCWECNGQENWINRTRYCNVFGCPLWHVRRGAGDASKEDCIAFVDRYKDK